MSGQAILYSFRRCPYAMRARMALLASGVQPVLREIVLRNKPAEMLAASPKGTVPVLVLADGRVIDESLDIMHWALAQNDPLGWLVGDDTDLIAANDGPFKAALDRYKYPHRHGSDPIAHRAVGVAHLALLNARLAESSFLHGPQPALTDIAIFPFIRQFAATDQDWFDAQPLPHVQRWLGALITAPLFAQAMHRYPLWQAGDTDCLLPVAVVG